MAGANNVLPYEKFKARKECVKSLKDVKCKKKKWDELKTDARIKVNKKLV